MGSNPISSAREKKRKNEITKWEDFIVKDYIKLNNEVMQKVDGFYQLEKD